MPIIVVVCALVSIAMLFQIDTLINKTLYSYELQFSNEWAVPYWSLIRTVFAMTWVIVITAIGLQVYNIAEKKAKKAIEGEPRMVPEEKRWSTYKLGDGSTIRVKLVLKSAKRLGTFSPDGTPLYSVTTDNIVQVVDFPQELRAKTEKVLN